MHPLAARRILRLAFGTALSLLVSQLFSWPLAFIAPVFTMFLLALPMPAPNIRQGLGMVLLVVLPMVASLGLVPLLLHARWAGILLVALAFWFVFRFTAGGGSPLLGTFMTIGLALVVTVGSVNQDVLVLLISAMSGNVLAGVAFVLVAHWALPDLPAAMLRGPPRRPARDGAAAARNATRSLVITLPLILLFLFSSASAAYVPVMIKVASLGQQASTAESRAMGLSLLSSTFWGSVWAVVVWWLLRIWPSLILYTLAVAIAGLLFGRRIFQGPAVHPDFSKWAYAFLTMLVLLGPAVTDSLASDGVAFVQRLGLFMLIAAYGTAAVAVFDACARKSGSMAHTDCRLEEISVSKTTPPAGG